MSEQIITTKTVETVGDLRRAMTKVHDDMPLRDHIKRIGLAVTLVKTDHGDILEIS
jgi:hypothetical protein